MSKIGTLTNLAKEYKVTSFPLTSETKNNFTFMPNQLIIGSPINTANEDNGSPALFATDENGEIMQLTYSLDMRYFTLLNDNTLTLNIQELRNALGV